MASQKLTNCCVAAMALVTAAYLSTPHSSTIARLAFGAFCLAMASQKFRPTALGRFFRISTYLMYAFAPEKPPTIVRVFAKASSR
jgi:hypothetical protein